MRIADQLRSEDEISAEAMLSIGAVVPQVSSMVKARLPKADAQIYTRRDMAKLLADFAKDILDTQSRAVMQHSRKRDT